MIGSSIHNRIAATCIFPCIVALCTTVAQMARARDIVAMMSAPLVSSTPITPDMPTSLRAAERIQEYSYELVQTSRGLGPITDGMADQGAATRTLTKAYPVLPVCQEWAYAPSAGDSSRFPYAVEANERLVDALDKLKQNSNGFLQWMLLHQRIVVTARPLANKGETYIMDRSVRVEIEADTLLHALEQLEVAYNNRYPEDQPLSFDPVYLHLLMKGPSEGSAQAGKLVLKMEAPLRELVLALLDEMQDPALCYSLADTSLEGNRFFQLRIARFDASNSDVSADQLAQGEAIDTRSQQRLQVSLDRVKKALAAKQTP